MVSNKAGVKKKRVRDVHCCTAYFDPGMTTLTKLERPFKLLLILFKHKDPQITDVSYFKTAPILEAI